MGHNMKCMPVILSQGKRETYYGLHMDVLDYFTRLFSHLTS